MIMLLFTSIYQSCYNKSLHAQTKILAAAPYMLILEYISSLHRDILIHMPFTDTKYVYLD